MPHPYRIMAIVLALVLPACVAAQEPTPPQPNPAKRVWVPDTGVLGAKIEVAGDTNPEFTLVLQREMPTPGWTFHVDKVEIDPGSNRITAKLTERAPTGMTAQVITPTRLELPLGRLPSGAYFVELSIRRNETMPHQPTHAMVLIAR